MPTQWIDFRALREKVNMLDVLRHYGVEVKIRGDQAIGLCPLPRHPARTDGKPRTASLSVNLARGIFKCFGCQARGNVIDYVCYCEGLDPADPQHVRQAAVKLSEWFDLNPTAPTDRPAPKAAKPRCANTTASGVDGTEGETARDSQQPQSNRDEDAGKEDSDDTDVLINPPLGFTLQHLDPTHPYLSGRGFMPATIAHFGLGYCARGMLRNRIAIPLHDSAGALIGYAGRIVGEQAVGDDCPKYLLPGRRKKDGVTIDFRKRWFLYNGWRIVEPVEDLVVCEGFPATWHLHQAGYGAVIGLMGSDCSQEQSALIVSRVRANGRVWVFTDADAAGDACAAKVITLVGEHRFVRRVPIMRGQPTDYAPDALSRLLWTRA
ncbi:MAG TPA: CHC2 zinc finger domain-containing protein [Tepidisphaeraceae bacterium]|jgi:DNA primase